MFRKIATLAIMLLVSACAQPGGYQQRQSPDPMAAHTAAAQAQCPGAVMIGGGPQGSVRWHCPGAISVVGVTPTPAPAPVAVAAPAAPAPAATAVATARATAVAAPRQTVVAPSRATAVGVGGGAQIIINNHPPASPTAAPAATQAPARAVPARVNDRVTIGT